MKLVLNIALFISLCLERGGSGKATGTEGNEINKISF